MVRTFFQGEKRNELKRKRVIKKQEEEEEEERTPKFCNNNTNTNNNNNNNNNNMPSLIVTQALSTNEQQAHRHRHDWLPIAMASGSRGSPCDLW